MTLFIMAFLIIAALVLLLWLFMRPLADELPSPGGSVALRLRRSRSGQMLL
jgi:hypothetical protein